MPCVQDSWIPETAWFPGQPYRFSKSPPFDRFEGHAAQSMIEHNSTRRKYHGIHTAHQPINGLC
jgi:hypothetical protein